MNIPRYLLSSSMLSGAVFCAATIPMAALDSQPTTIQIGDDPVFVGQLKELAAPYLGLATLASLGMGVMTLSVLGWSQSSSKVSKSEDEIAQLRKDLRDRESLIEQLKFSDARLEASGLGAFIEDDEVDSDLAHRRQHSVRPQAIPEMATPQTQPYEVYYQVPTAIASSDRLIPEARQSIEPAQAANGRVQRPPVPVMASAQTQNSNRPKAAHRHGAKPPVPPRHPDHRSATSSNQTPNASLSHATRQQSLNVAAVAEQASHANPDQLNDLLTQIQQVMVRVEQLQQGNAAA